jgi:hypothetical protein
MRETVRSLRAYFILVALVTGYLDVTALRASPRPLELVLRVASLLVGAGFLYLGAVLPSILVSATQRIYVILAAGAGIGLVSGLLVLLLAPSVAVLGAQAFGLLVYAYLFANVKRLAAAA